MSAESLANGPAGSDRSAGTQSAARLRKRPARATLIGLSLIEGVAFLVVLEITARWVLGERFLPGLHTGTPQRAFGRYDADLGWTIQPNVDTRVIASTFSYDVRTNSKGLRDREHAYEKPNGVVRIVLLGDSVGWGWGVDNGQGFADLLEQRLGARVEIINLCVPGYSTDQEYWVLEREGARYQPDLVLLCFIQNDIINNWNSIDKPCYVRSAAGAWTLENRPVQDSAIRAHARVPTWHKWLYANSAVLQCLRPPRASGRSPPEWEEQAVRSRRPGAGERFPNNYEEGLDDFLRADGITHMLLGRIQELARGLGAGFLVFNVPGGNDPYLLDPALPMPALLDERPFMTRLSRTLHAAGELLGFQTCSVDQALLDEVRTGRVLHCGDQWHLNQRGNEAVADVLEKPLRAWIDKRRADAVDGD